MEFMTYFIIGHVFLAIILIVSVLLQSGKGAEMGVAFGSGSNQSVFGSSGGASFFTRFTGIVATLFMLTSITLTFITASRTSSELPENVIRSESATAPTTDEMPAGTTKDPSEGASDGAAKGAAPDSTTESEATKQ